MELEDILLSAGLLCSCGSDEWFEFYRDTVTHMISVFMQVSVSRCEFRTLVQHQRSLRAEG